MKCLLLWNKVPKAYLIFANSSSLTIEAVSDYLFYFWKRKYKFLDRIA